MAKGKVEYVNQTVQIKTCRGCEKRSVVNRYGMCQKTGAICAPDSCDQSKMVLVTVKVPSFLQKAGVKE